MCCALTLLLWPFGCAEEPSAPPVKPRVAVTIFPLYDITRNIVGDKIDVVEILTAGASPHTFELTPQDIVRLQGVRIIFRIGHGLDDWTKTIAGTLPDAEMVLVDKGINLIYSSAPDAEHHAGEEGANPHYWLSISDGGIIAGNIEEEVSRLDPENRGYYKANLEAYLLELNRTRKEIEEKVSKLKNKNIITFHDSWAYYANEFGLNVVGTFEPFAGRQPTPRELAALGRKAREYDVKAIFTEPQLSAGVVQSFVEDVGLKLYVLDPLGGVNGRKTYTSLLMYNTDVIVKALSNEQR